MNRYLVPDDVKIQHLSVTQHFYPDQRPLLSFQLLAHGGIAQFHAGNIFTVHHNNAVTVQQSDFLRGTAGDHGNNHQRVPQDRKLNAYPVKSPFQRFIHLLHFLLGNIDRMRVKVGQHLHNGILRQFRQIDRIHIKSINQSNQPLKLQGLFPHIVIVALSLSCRQAPQHNHY